MAKQHQLGQEGIAVALTLAQQGDVLKSEVDKFLQEVRAA